VLPVRYAGDTAEPEDTLCDPLSRSRAACHSMNPLARSRCTESLPFSRLAFSFSTRIRCPLSPIILMVKSLVKRLALTHLIPRDFMHGQAEIIIWDKRDRSLLARALHETPLFVSSRFWERSRGLGGSAARRGVIVEPSGIKRYRGSFPRSLDEPDRCNYSTGATLSLHVER
jgi:hypothetical protein